LSKADGIPDHELPLGRGVASGNERAILPRLGTLPIIGLGRSDGSTEMALSDPSISTPGPRWSGIVELVAI
jgi:hypothetical protein